jgi:hypothetical protein
MVQTSHQPLIQHTVSCGLSRLYYYDEKSFSFKGQYVHMRLFIYRYYGEKFF